MTTTYILERTGRDTGEVYEWGDCSYPRLIANVAQRRRDRFTVWFRDGDRHEIDANDEGEFLDRIEGLCRAREEAA